MDQCRRTLPYMDICPRCRAHAQLILGLKKTTAVCIECAIDPTWTNPQENWGEGGVVVSKGQEFYGNIGTSRIIVQHPKYTVFEQLNGDKELIILYNYSGRAYVLPRRNGKVKFQIPNVPSCNTQVERPSIEKVHSCPLLLALLMNGQPPKSHPLAVSKKHAKPPGGTVNNIRTALQQVKVNEIGMDKFETQKSSNVAMRVYGNAVANYTEQNNEINVNNSLHANYKQAASLVQLNPVESLKQQKIKQTEVDLPNISNNTPQQAAILTCNISSQENCSQNEPEKMSKNGYLYTSFNWPSTRRLPTSIGQVKPLEKKQICNQIEKEKATNKVDILYPIQHPQLATLAQLNPAESLKQQKYKQTEADQPSISKEDNFYPGKISNVMANSVMQTNKVSSNDSRLAHERNWVFHEFSRPQYEPVMTSSIHNLQTQGMFCCTLTNHSQNSTVDAVNNCCVQASETNWTPNQDIARIQREGMPVYAQHAKLPIVRGAEHAVPPEGAIEWRLKITQDSVYQTELSNLSHQLSSCYANSIFSCELNKQNTLHKLATSTDISSPPKCASNWSYKVGQNNMLQTDEISNRKPLANRYQTSLLCSNMANPMPLAELIIHKQQVQIPNAINWTCNTTRHENQMETRTLANKNLDNCVLTDFSYSEFVNPQTEPQLATFTEQASLQKEPVDLTYKSVMKEIHGQHASNQESSVLYPCSIFNSDSVIAESLPTSTEQAKPQEEGLNMDYKMGMQEKCTQIEPEEMSNQQVPIYYPYSIVSLPSTKALPTSIEQVKPPEKDRKWAKEIATQNCNQVEKAKARNKADILHPTQHPQLAMLATDVEIPQQATVMTCKTSQDKSPPINKPTEKKIEKTHIMVKLENHNQVEKAKASNNKISSQQKFTQMNKEEPSKVKNMDTSPLTRTSRGNFLEFETMEDFKKAYRADMFATPNKASNAKSNMEKDKGNGNENEDGPCIVHHFLNISNPKLTMQEISNGTANFQSPQSKETEQTADFTPQFATTKASNNKISSQQKFTQMNKEEPSKVKNMDTSPLTHTSRGNLLEFETMEDFKKAYLAGMFATPNKASNAKSNMEKDKGNGNENEDGPCIVHHFLNISNPKLTMQEISNGTANFQSPQSKETEQTADFTPKFGQYDMNVVEQVLNKETVYQCEQSLVQDDDTRGSAKCEIANEKGTTPRIQKAVSKQLTRKLKLKRARNYVDCPEEDTETTQSKVNMLKDQSDEVVDIGNGERQSETNEGEVTELLQNKANMSKSQQKEDESLNSNSGVHCKTGGKDQIGPRVYTTESQNIQKAVSKQLTRKLKLKRPRNNVYCAEEVVDIGYGGKQSQTSKEEVTEIPQNKVDMSKGQQKEEKSLNTSHSYSDKQFKTSPQSVLQRGTDQTDTKGNPSSHIKVKNRNTGRDNQEDKKNMIDCIDEFQKSKIVSKQMLKAKEAPAAIIQKVSQSNTHEPTVEVSPEQPKEKTENLKQDYLCQNDTMKIYKELRVELVNTVFCLEGGSILEEALGKADKTSQTTQPDSSHRSKIVGLLVKQHEDWRDWNLEINRERRLVLRNGKFIKSSESLPMYQDQEEFVEHIYRTRNFNKMQSSASPINDNIKTVFKEKSKRQATEFEHQVVAKKRRTQEQQCSKSKMNRDRKNKGQGQKSPILLKVSQKHFGILQMSVSSVPEDVRKHPCARKAGKSIHKGFSRTKMERKRKQTKKMAASHVRKMNTHTKSKDPRQYNQKKGHNLAKSLKTKTQSSSKGSSKKYYKRGSSNNEDFKTGINPKKEISLKNYTKKHWTPNPHVPNQTDKKKKWSQEQGRKRENNNLDKSKANRTKLSVKILQDPKRQRTLQICKCFREYFSKYVNVNSKQKDFRKTMEISKQESQPEMERKEKTPTYMTACKDSTESQASRHYNLDEANYVSSDIANDDEETMQLEDVPHCSKDVEMFYQKAKPVKTKTSANVISNKDYKKGMNSKKHFSLKDYKKKHRTQDNKSKYERSQDNENCKICLNQGLPHCSKDVEMFYQKAKPVKPKTSGNVILNKDYKKGMNSKKHFSLKDYKKKHRTQDNKSKYERSQDNENCKIRLNQGLPHCSKDVEMFYQKAKPVMPKTSANVFSNKDYKKGMNSKKHFSLKDYKRKHRTQDNKSKYERSQDNENCKMPLHQGLPQCSKDSEMRHDVCEDVWSQNPAQDNFALSVNPKNVERSVNVISNDYKKGMNTKKQISLKDDKKNKQSQGERSECKNKMPLDLKGRSKPNFKVSRNAGFRRKKLKQYFIKLENGSKVVGYRKTHRKKQQGCLDPNAYHASIEFTNSEYIEMYKHIENSMKEDKISQTGIFSRSVNPSICHATVKCEMIDNLIKENKASQTSTSSSELPQETNSLPGQKFTEKPCSKTQRNLESQVSTEAEITKISNQERKSDTRNDYGKANKPTQPSEIIQESKKLYKPDHVKSRSYQNEWHSKRFSPTRYHERMKNERCGGLARMRRESQNANTNFSPASMPYLATSSQERKPLKAGQFGEHNDPANLDIQIHVFDRNNQRIDLNIKEESISSWFELWIKALPANRQSSNELLRMTMFLTHHTNSNLIFREWGYVSRSMKSKSFQMLSFTRRNNTLEITLYVHAVGLWACVKELSESSYSKREKCFIAIGQTYAENFTHYNGGFETCKPRESWVVGRVFQNQNERFYYDARPGYPNSYIKSRTQYWNARAIIIRRQHEAQKDVATSPETEATKTER